MTASPEPFPLPLDYRPAGGAFEGRCVLVSGATGELGRAASIALAEHGARVALLGRNRPRLEALAQQLGAYGGEPPLIVLDYLQATWDDYGRVAGCIHEAFGRLDAWLHASAELGPLVGLEHYPPTRWAAVMHINLNVPFLLAQRLLPELRRVSDAAIAFVLADCVWRGKAYWGAFAAANHGLRAVAETLADELEQEGRVRVNALVPGPLDSRLWRAAYPALPPDRLPGIARLIPGLLFLLGPHGAEPTGRIYAPLEGRPMES